MGGLNRLLSRIPFLTIAVLYCGWLAYGYYDWLNSPTSELATKKTQLTQSKQLNEKVKAKLKEADEFYKGYDIQRARVRQLYTQLESAKGMLNADIDVANFLRMISLEAKKLGIVIKKMKPDAETKKEFYTEVPFSVDLTGAFVQMLVLFDRIARFQQIVRVDTFGMKPSGSNVTKYVELAGSVRLLTYKYQGTDADEVLKKQEMVESTPGSAQTQAPATTPTGGDK